MWFYILLIAIFLGVLWYLSIRPPPVRIEGSHMIVTGGSSGIGLSLAVELSKRGANVTIIARDKGKLKLAREKIESVKKNENQLILDYSVDVSDYKSVTLSIEDSINKNSGKIDVLIASAGDTRPERFDDIDISNFNHLMKVNYLGSVYCTKTVIPFMKEKNRGRIIYVSSLVGLMGYPSYSGYSASKFALRGLAESLALEYCPWNINFSISIPPNVDTPMYKEEEKIKPPETKALEGEHSVASAEDIALSIIDSLKSYKFFIPYGMDGTLVSWVAGSGFSPGSFREVLCQVFFGGILRIVSMFYLWTWQRIVKKIRLNK
jgi:3-dehydrosphinganine reductase